MSFLSNELSALLEKRGLKQIDLTHSVGLHVSTVSRIFTGQTKHPEDAQLDKIIGFLAQTPLERAKIVRARHSDGYNGVYSNLVKIRLNTPGGGKGKADRLEISADPEVKRAVEFLCRLVPANPAVGKSLVQWARMMGMDSGR